MNAASDANRTINQIHLHGVITAFGVVFQSQTC